MVDFEFRRKLEAIFDAASAESEWNTIVNFRDLLVDRLVVELTQSQNPAWLPQIGEAVVGTGRVSSIVREGTYLGPGKGFGTSLVRVNGNSAREVWTRTLQPASSQTAPTLRAVA